MNAIFLTSNDAQRLARDVDGALRNGYDLQGGLVAAGDEIGQWVVKAPALYDYRLVIAASSAILEALVNGHIDEGWDYYRDTLLWDGNYLQWMMRENQAHALFVVGVDDRIPDDYDHPNTGDAAQQLAFQRRALVWRMIFSETSHYHRCGMVEALNAFVDVTGVKAPKALVKRAEEWDAEIKAAATVSTATGKGKSQ